MMELKLCIGLVELATNKRQVHLARHTFDDTVQSF